eukprot:2923270-Alexandrium_andersonii.AAC.1
MQPGACNALAQEVRLCAQSGVCPADLLLESKELNLTPTCEQPAEGVHARVSLANLRPGRHMQPPMIVAKMNSDGNLRLFSKRWRMQMFGASLWN